MMPDIIVVTRDYSSPSCLFVVIFLNKGHIYMQVLMIEEVMLTDKQD